MNKLWSWLTDLPSSSPLPLASSSHLSILLSAHPTTTPPLLTLSISLISSHSSTKTLWISQPFHPISTPTTHLLLQLLHEVTIPQLPTIDPSRLLLDLAAIPDTRNLLCLALLLRLFWLCAGEKSADAGFLFFSAFDAALEGALDCGKSLRAFLLVAGADREERFMRSVGYMLAKWCVFRDLDVTTETRGLPVACCQAYAAEPHVLFQPLSWTPPPPGWLKANIDGSFRDSCSGTIAAVVRDAQGQLIAATGCSIQTMDSTRAELQAIVAIRRIMLPWMTEFKGLIVEGDNLSIIRYLQQSFNTKEWQARPAEAPDISFLKDFHVVLFSHVRRELNRVADRAASIAADGEFIWWPADLHFVDATFLSLLLSEVS